MLRFWKIIKKNSFETSLLKLKQTLTKSSYVENMLKKAALLGNWWSQDWLHKVEVLWCVQCNSMRTIARSSAYRMNTGNLTIWFHPILSELSKHLQRTIFHQCQRESKLNPYWLNKMRENQEYKIHRENFIAPCYCQESEPTQLIKRHVQQCHIQSGGLDIVKHRWTLNQLM